ncbi:spermatogenesis-associated protein 31E1-like isoform X2 [Mustela erminea]|uniref:spermatogenesis-associated protein 31E1-like isoform X2 n=1 Tax=Mustela erminea TaxID=36723 RepID=UPI001387289A|nr:spermatogenesis-associated protein 31E1-like isoform X2 [Mustela erminea]
MENYLFPQEFLTDGWLSSSPTLWAVNAICAFVCGLGLFIFILSYFQPDPSSPRGKKHRKSRKYQVEPRRRSNRIKYQTVKGFRECLKNLEEVQDLFFLMESHLERLSDQGGFHQFLRQAAPGQVRRGVPAGARQPCREPLQDAAPAVAPSPALTPLTGSPRPLASTLPAEPMSSSIAVASYSSLTTSWLAEPFLPRDGFPHQPLALPPSPPCLPPSEASPGPLTASLAPERPDSPLTLPQCDSRAPLPAPSHRARLHTRPGQLTGQLLLSQPSRAWPAHTAPFRSCPGGKRLPMPGTCPPQHAWSPVKRLCPMAHQKPCSGETPHTNRKRLGSPLPSTRTSRRFWRHSLPREKN